MLQLRVVSVKDAAAASGIRQGCALGGTGTHQYPQIIRTVEIVHTSAPDVEPQKEDIIPPFEPQPFHTTASAHKLGNNPMSPVPRSLVTPLVPCCDKKITAHVFYSGWISMSRPIMNSAYLKRDNNRGSYYNDSRKGIEIAI